MTKTRPFIGPKPPDTPRERSEEKPPVAAQTIEIGLLAVPRISDPELMARSTHVVAG